MSPARAMGVTMLNLGLGWSIREAGAVRETLQAIGRSFA